MERVGRDESKAWKIPNGRAAARRRIAGTRCAAQPRHCGGQALREPPSAREPDPTGTTCRFRARHGGRLYAKARASGASGPSSGP